MFEDQDLRANRRSLRLFLCGDVMCGRGIDQVLAHPCSPEIYEDYMRSAEDYVLLAEQANGPIPRRNGPSYVWGAALKQLERMQPEARIINLETAVTRSNDHAPKGINYRMSPENAACLTAAKIDCCALANNHVLDWGRAGLNETLATLQKLNIKVAGAGRNALEACAPAVLNLSKARLLVFSFGSPSSGAPADWAATNGVPGVNLLPELSETSALRVADQIMALKKPGDLVIVSIHWGSNWGYHIPDEQRVFAHALVDKAGVSVIHGHSSHHPRSIEIYRDRLILYGCGDLLNDYEGIRGYARYRDDLVLMYFVDLAPTGGSLHALKLLPFQIKNFRLSIPSQSDVEWIQATLDRECRRLGTTVTRGAESQLEVTAGDVPLRRRRRESSNLIWINDHLQSAAMLIRKAACRT
jgi:poly-gamma-glutamate synthesis protein (capsule biosynthesis protein)